MVVMVLAREYIISHRDKYTINILEEGITKRGNRKRCVRMCWRTNEAYRRVSRRRQFHLVPPIRSGLHRLLTCNVHLIQLGLEIGSECQHVSS